MKPRRRTYRCSSSRKRTSKRRSFSRRQCPNGHNHVNTDYTCRRHRGGNEPLVTPEQLQQTREQQQNHPINNFIANTSTLAHNFITNLGNKIGINTTDPKILKSQIHNAAETGAELLEAADPFIQPLVDKTIAEGEKAASKIGEAAVKIGLNTAEEIPGVGVLIGTVRSLSNAGEAATAAMNAAAEIATTTADTVNATTQNWKRLQTEKMAAMARTQKSINQFTGGNGL